MTDHMDDFTDASDSQTPQNGELPENSQFAPETAADNYGDAPPNGDFKLKDETPSSDVLPEPEPDPIPDAFYSEGADYGLSREQIDDMGQADVERYMSTVDAKVADALMRQGQQPGFMPNSGQIPGQFPAQHLPQQHNFGFNNSNGPTSIPGRDPATGRFMPQQQFQQPMPNPAQGPPPPEEFKLQLDQSEWDQTAVNAFGAMTEHINKLQSQMHQQKVDAYQQQAYEQQMQQQNDYQQMQELQYLDMQLQQNEDLRDEFGQGSFQMLNPHSPEYNNRMRVIDTYESLKAAYPQADNMSVLNRAIRATFGKQIEQKKQQQLSDQVGKRSAKTISRPSRNNQRAQDRRVDPQSGVSVGTLKTLQDEYAKVMNGESVL